MKRAAVLVLVLAAALAACSPKSSAVTQASLCQQVHTAEAWYHGGTGSQSSEATLDKTADTYSTTYGDQLGADAGSYHYDYQVHGFPKAGNDLVRLESDCTGLGL